MYKTNNGTNEYKKKNYMQESKKSKNGLKKKKLRRSVILITNDVGKSSLVLELNVACTETELGGGEVTPQC